MRIKNSYRVELSEQFIKLLEELDISYEILNIFTPPIIQFVLFNDDARKKDIDSHLPPWHIIIPKLIFSKSEYEDATWYRFMPKYDKIPTTDSSLTYSFFCKYSDGTVNYDSTHKRQIGYYRLSQSPRWPKKVCILSGEGNYNQKWFTNDITRALLENSGIRGLRFDPVFMEKKTCSLRIHGRSCFRAPCQKNRLLLEKNMASKMLFLARAVVRKGIMYVLKHTKCAYITGIWEIKMPMSHKQLLAMVMDTILLLDQNISICF